MPSLAVALAVALAGCAALSPSPIPVDIAPFADSSTLSTVAVDPSEPVLVRGVDGRLLPGVHVSNWLRPLSYTLQPGNRVLWLSQLPHPIPFVPQSIDCHVLRATLTDGSSYVLRLDRTRGLPVLSSLDETEPEVVGALVDRAFLPERGCRWR